MIDLIGTAQLVILAASSPDQCVQMPSTLHRQIIHEAAQCVNMDGEFPLEEALLILEIEESLRVPRELRGLSLVAACAESGFSNVRGDCHLRDDCPAVGWFQIWPWARKSVDRWNPVASAEFWIQRVVDRVSRAHEECGYLGLRAWRSAWATAVRTCVDPPRCRIRCDQTPRSWQSFLDARNASDTMSIDLVSFENN